MSENIKIINFSIPQNADKILFAEDFVNYSLTQFALPPLPSNLETYRSVIHNAFNQRVIVAANCLYKRLEKENLAEFESLRMHETLNRNSFMSYVTSVELEYLSWGFDAQKFLHFCVKTITMALKFYSCGFSEGPALAAQRIAKALDSFDMSSGEWDQVNVIAEKYAKIYADVDKPSDSESEYESASSSVSGESSDTSDDFRFVTNPSQANGSEHVNGGKCSEFASGSYESSSSELYEVSSFKVMCIVDEERKGIQTAIPCLQLDSKCLKATSSASYDPKTPSANEAKPEDDDQGSTSSNSVYYDTDEDFDSDVVEHSASVGKPCRRDVRRVAKKRPASSSSTSGFHMQDSAEKSDAQLTSHSTTSSVCNEDLPLTEPTCSVETSDVEVSPVRKHIAKSRRNF